MVDILFCTFNRIRFTQESFTALLANTDWDEVAGLYLADDASTDGTAEWLAQAASDFSYTIPVHLNSGRFGGPVAAMTWYLNAHDDQADRFFKCDNDFILPPGWLPEMLRVMTINPGVDALGVQPRFGPPTTAPDYTRTIEDARHIGGIGMMRHRMFEVCRPVAAGRYGWSEFQTRHPESRKAWLVPDLPAFSLDLIGAEPWRGLARDYVAAGWAREWPEYESGGAGYFDWWEPVSGE